MKSLFFRFCLFVCIMLFSLACSNSARLSDNEFLIEGKISGIEDGTTIELSMRDGDGKTISIADTIKNGRFSFRAETSSDLDQVMIFNRNDNGFPPMQLRVWIAPGAVIKINGNGKLHPTWEVKSTIPNQKEENRYANNSRDILTQYARVTLEINELGEKARAAVTEEEANEFIKTRNLLIPKIDSLNLKRAFADIEIMEKTAVSPIWLEKMNYIANRYKLADPDNNMIANLRQKAQELYGKISEDDKNSPLGIAIKTSLFHSVVNIGNDFADTDLVDTDGNTVRLSDYSGKYILLDFWASWCVPCIMAFPELKEVSEIYQDILTIISIDDEDDAVWKEALAKHDMIWVNVRDPKSSGRLLEKYGVTEIPNYILISPNGKIVDKWKGYAEGFVKRKLSENIK